MCNFAYPFFCNKCSDGRNLILIVPVAYFSILQGTRMFWNQRYQKFHGAHAGSKARLQLPPSPFPLSTSQIPCTSSHGSCGVVAFIILASSGGAACFHFPFFSHLLSLFHGCFEWLLVTDIMMTYQCDITLYAPGDHAPCSKWHTIAHTISDGWWCSLAEA